MYDSDNKRVLIVDDHPKVVRFIEIDLKRRGYEVITAGSGDGALELVKTARPDIMLLDIIMPGMDGFEVLERLRSFTQLPVIAFSANADNRSNAMLHGASDFMAKPFEPDEMARCIKGILDHSGNGKNQSR